MINSVLTPITSWTMIYAINEEISYGQQVELCIDLADMIVLNNGSLENFYDKIDALTGLADHTRKRDLTKIEIHMQAAYSMARSSKCLKRHVGAVLVDALGRVVAAGYNENPSGTKPCVEETVSIPLPPRHNSESAFCDAGPAWSALPSLRHSNSSDRGSALAMPEVRSRRPKDKSRNILLSRPSYDLVHGRSC